MKNNFFSTEEPLSQSDQLTCPEVGP